ncbi:MAG: PAS domain-containing protein, partial [Anaerolineae bacterium]|nr:PAS domain-containing protein [Anaerolineae bacterium]
MGQTAILDEKTALQRQIEALQAERSQLLLENSFLRRATADLSFHQNAHDGIIYLNARHEIIYANPYFLEMLGLDSPEQILNKPFPSFMWGNPGDEAALVQNIKSDGFVREQELALYDQHGQPIFAV